MNTTTPDELQPEWVTDAPANLTVGEAEQFECAGLGLSWPISGDATTIAANTP